MPRRPRIKLAGIPQHIVQRGVNREPCFFADENCQCDLHWLFKSAADWHCQVHAYVLMTNHVHLLVTPATPDALAKMMQSIGRRYVQYVNRFYKRSGTLWEGRFKSSLVQTEDYFLLCQRYIELNPVRARMVDDPAMYQWSSYRHHALGKTEQRLCQHPQYLALGLDAETRMQAYRDLFRYELDEAAIADLRVALVQGQAFGNEKFKDAMSAASGVRRTQPKRGRPVKLVKEVNLKEQTDFGF
ncbi:transposase [Undibacterium sp. TC9W]|uniref:transposase n=1 Tax=Undibacterium sp. TC9W TaxID=3413053 RepID=UPI003BF1DF93